MVFIRNVVCSSCDPEDSANHNNTFMSLSISQKLLVCRRYVWKICIILLITLYFSSCFENKQMSVWGSCNLFPLWKFKISAKSFIICIGSLLFEKSNQLNKTVVKFGAEPVGHALFEPLWRLELRIDQHWGKPVQYSKTT